jgi:hypothetical protein
MGNSCRGINAKLTEEGCQQIQRSDQTYKQFDRGKYMQSHINKGDIKDIILPL